MSPQEHVASAKERKDWQWEYFRCMSPADRAAFDAWLVETQHPLAFEPGTTEQRFRALATA